MQDEEQAIVRDFSLFVRNWAEESVPISVDTIDGARSTALHWPEACDNGTFTNAIRKDCSFTLPTILECDQVEFGDFQPVAQLEPESATVTPNALRTVPNSDTSPDVSKSTNPTIEHD